MDLLNEKQSQKTQPSKGKKIVLTLLLCSVISAIAIIAIMIFLEANKVTPEILKINGEQKEEISDLTIKDTNGNKYIALKDLAEFLGYEYDSSEYQKYGTDTTKCYIKNGNLISGFEIDSNKMYKYEEGTTLDYQYYTLKHNIITYNNRMYVALTDLQKALNLECIINQNGVTEINSTNYLVSVYEEKLKDTGYTISPDQNNQKAIAYGWIIVSKNGIWSVLDPEFEEIIGSKYSSIYFDECNMNYIVSNTNGQYGIITPTGTIEQPLKYDYIEIINYKNMLYKVANSNQYGIMKKDGTLLTKIAYEDIGYKAEPAKKILYTLIIPDLDGKTGETIVVKQKGKYGLVYLETGEEFLPCDHVEKLYSVNELGKINYKIEAEKKTMNLLDYIRYRESQTINL